MVTVDMSAPLGRISLLPRKQELRAMLDRTPVAVAAIVAVTVVVLGFLAALTFLAATGHSAETLTVALVAPIVGLLVSIASRTKATADVVHKALPPAQPTDGDR